ncbi:MAG TPA: NAD-dependent epimerase/dehydratase family protein [Candidatus Dormibacteraeota bacterium]|nr:NAD-dependent epimerase/dehydratase family protein [Candidatus Dormibacteraeota bacterium]
MTGSAVVVGGTGCVGTAVVRRLAECGWRVTSVSRGLREPAADLSHLPIERRTLDRDGPSGLADAVPPGTDVLVDVMARGRVDAEQVLAVAGRVGSVVAISTTAVYADARTGRKLLSDLAGSAWPSPIPESQPTVAPGDDDSSARKVAMERLLLERHPAPVTIVRPGAVYGPGNLWAREWHFVKRVLDGRRVVVLVARGASRFHPVAAASVAELVRLAAELPGRRVLNAADARAHSALEIAYGVADAMDWGWDAVLLDGEVPDEGPGLHPWATARPLVFDTTAARRELGFADAVPFEAGMAATCEWLRSATAGRDWADVIPGAARLYGDLFDYAAEDALVRALGERAGA